MVTELQLCRSDDNSLDLAELMRRVYRSVEYREQARRQPAVMNGAVMTIIHRDLRQAYEKLEYREAARGSCATR